jgi:hypothetical protein
VKQLYLFQHKYIRLPILKQKIKLTGVFEKTRPAIGDPIQSSLFKKANKGGKSSHKRYIFGKKKYKKCEYCTVILSYEDSTIDHIVPISKGGPNNLSNIVLSCHLDNRLRGNISFDLYKRVRSYYMICRMLAIKGRLAGYRKWRLIELKNNRKKINNG